MDLSIIIVNYKGWSSLEDCLDELASYRSERLKSEVIIVDNDSGDGILDSFRGKYNASFIFIQNKLNGGFANGCNLGASVARGEYLLFINPDTVAAEDTVAILLERAKQKPDDCLLSCNQVNSNGRVSKAYGNFLALGMLTGPGRAVSRVLKGKKLQPQVSGNMIIPDWISGSVIMMTKKFFQKLGGFDEDYWMYFEDMDICRRAKNAGGEICYFTDLTIKHDHGGSSRINTKTTALTKTEVLISRHIYISKHFSGITKILSHSMLVFFNLCTCVINAVSGIVFFFLPKFLIRLLIFLRLTVYYMGAIVRRSWRSPLSVNSQKQVDT